MARILIRELSVEAAYNELNGLFKDHDAEVEHGTGLKADVDWSALDMLHSKRQLLILGAYEGEGYNAKPVGYAAFVIFTPIHYRETLFAVTDAFYVIPEARGKGVFSMLKASGLRKLKAEGVAFLQIISPGKMPGTEIIHRVKVQ